MHICQAVCCRLNFPLNQQEVERGVVKWDLGRPYFIRRELNGYCAHNVRPSGQCTVYANRPLVCRHYSCRNDDRIWNEYGETYDPHCVVPHQPSATISSPVATKSSATSLKNG